MHHHAPRDRNRVLPLLPHPEDLDDVAVEQLGVLRAVREDLAEREIQRDAILAPQRVTLPERDHPVHERASLHGGRLNPAGKPQEIPESFARRQLVDGAPVDLAQDRGHLARRGHEDHVAALEPHVLGLVAGEDVSVEVDVLPDLVVPDDPDVAHRAAGGGSAGVIERVQHGAHRGDRVAAGADHVAQDEDLDGSELAQRHVDERRGPPRANARVDHAEPVRDQALGLGEREAVQHDLADVGDADRGLAGHDGGVRELVVAPD